MDTFENLSAIVNTNIGQWLPQIKAIAPTYSPSTTWPSNKTLVVKKATGGYSVFPLDVLMTIGVLVEPQMQQMADLELALPVIIQYFTNAIQKLCNNNVTVANEIRFRLDVHVPTEYTGGMAAANGLTESSAPCTASCLGTAFDKGLKRFRLVFYFDAGWKLAKRPAAAAAAEAAPPQQPAMFSYTGISSPFGQPQASPAAPPQFSLGSFGQQQPAPSQAPFAGSSFGQQWQQPSTATPSIFGSITPPTPTAPTASSFSFSGFGQQNKPFGAFLGTK